MYKNRIQHIVIHKPSNWDTCVIADKVSGFHISIIERRLQLSSLTTEQKIAVIDKILKSLKSREINEFIQ